MTGLECRGRCHVLEYGLPTASANQKGEGDDQSGEQEADQSGEDHWIIVLIQRSGSRDH